MPGASGISGRDGNLGRFFGPPTPTVISGDVHHYDPYQVTAGYSMAGGAHIDVPPERQGLWVKMRIPKYGNAVATADFDPRVGEKGALVVMVDVVNHGKINVSAAENAEMFSIDIGKTGSRKRVAPFGVFPIIVKSMQTGDVLFTDPTGYNTIPRPVVRPA